MQIGMADIWSQLWFNICLCGSLLFVGGTVYASLSNYKKKAPATRHFLFGLYLGIYGAGCFACWAYDGSKLLIVSVSSFLVGCLAAVFGTSSDFIDGLD
jgi:uncharacterized membrane protein